MLFKKTIFAAAVADYRPVNQELQKIKKKEETLTERLDISSLLRASGKRPDFLTQQRDDIVSTFEKDVKETTSALAETYQKKIEANPEDYDKLNKEYLLTIIQLSFRELQPIKNYYKSLQNIVKNQY